MAKSFRMLAPFDVVTGNVSGAQKLEYPLNGGSAYDAPAGSKQYAQNYKPRFVMHERKSDGKLYFQLRQRTCVHKTAKSTLAMAALGAGGAIIGAILADKTSALYGALMAAYNVSDKKKTFRKFLSDEIISGLKSKINMFMWTYFSAGQLQAVMLNNPYQSGGVGTYDVTISNDVLVKFWSVLANNPISFTIDGKEGIAHEGDAFKTVAEGHYNVLGLTLDPLSVQGKEYVQIGSDWIMGRDTEDESAVPEYCESRETIYATGEEYTLTSVAPTE